MCVVCTISRAQKVTATEVSFSEESKKKIINTQNIKYFKMNISSLCRIFVILMHSCVDSRRVVVRTTVHAREEGG